MLASFLRLFRCARPATIGKEQTYKPSEDGVKAEEQQQQPQKQNVFELAACLLKAKTEALLANDQALLSQEYNSLLECESAVGTVEAAEQSSNAGKNRYVNVLPFDFNRVKISGEDGQDYINASLVQSASQETPNWCYIAAQGPLASTVDDFWKMVFENRASILIMLTRTVENNHIKCADYFNQRPGETAKFGAYRVTTTDVQEVSPDITKRTLQLKLYTVRTQEVHEVTHYHYHRWPDFGVPEATDPIRRLVRILWQSRSQQQTTVVHCSAGIGRTGTLMAIDVILRRLWAMVEEGTPAPAEDVKAALDLPAVVLALRKQRKGMVQTLEQYYFCYEALLHEMQDSIGREEAGKLPGPCDPATAG
ncbi:Protein-tyrosine-phosphatase PTP1 [Tetrabaena socialis]|uniref:Protein-tyrosine-phosphatase PTP1 n=1 Tax=Tetrabaena socialis TaxID=47790 RepID=A0A2J8AJV7_9CHLO|nr:Protein-tyrosine-phosphatase PTP1 [Tetrabaena socialis]|eukprot:PNH12804.1 Protein-tyrosine-phosphatase PTP1 [Tetrabaena socialis]